MRHALVLMLLIAPLAAEADRYDEAVAAAFPGYRIMGSSEIGLVRSEMEPALYAEVKDHPGLIFGDFDGDGRSDFAALIRHPEKRRDQWSEYYDGRLAACYGRSDGKFDCVSITTMHVHLPHAWYLSTVPPGKQHCYGSRTHDIDDPTARDENGDESDITTARAAIGEFRVMGNGDVIYAYRTRRRYTLCIVSD